MINMQSYYFIFNHKCDILQSGVTINELGEQINTGYTIVYSNIPVVYKPMFLNNSISQTEQTQSLLKFKFHIPLSYNNIDITLNKNNKVRYNNTDFTIVDIQKLDDFYLVVAAK